MAHNGAGRVILVSRSGKRASGISEAIVEMEKNGAKVDILSVDVSDPQKVRELVREASSPPFVLRGIVHGAMVLDDSLMADLNEDRFRRVFAPKAAGALHLAESIRECPSLDFILFYSSVSALVGNRWQTNYVVANSILDGLAHKLRLEGIPALSINWGTLAESGVVARDNRIGAILASSGITGLGNDEAFEALEIAMRRSSAQLGAFRVDWSKWHESNPKLSDDPRFRELRIRSQESGGSDAASQVKQTLSGMSKEQRLRALESHLQEVLAGTLKMSKESVSITKKLNEMGVDSLMVLELSLGIRDRIGVSFSAMEFLRGPSLQQLAMTAESRLWSS